jgi:predicted MFS family arabinose efflux permease
VTRTTGVSIAEAAGDRGRLPWLPLGLLTLIGFVLVAMETMPAGLLPEIAAGFHVNQGTVGLLVSAYAIGTVVVTVPAISLTRSLPRKPLLLIAVSILLIANAVTAISPTFGLALASRVVAGAMSGIIWGMFATYARQISPRRFAGLSLAIVSTGAPLGFALGTPLGSVLGIAFGWQWAFAGLSIIGLVVLALLVFFLHPVPGQSVETRLSVGGVIRIPGLWIILAVIIAWMIAHNAIYTYIYPYLQFTGTAISASLMLVVYGVAAVGGVVITGALLDRHPRPLLHLSVLVFVIAGAMLTLGSHSAAVILIAAVLWGIGFGGAATQLQAAITSLSGDNADVASSFLPVAFNIAIFAAGIVGAALLTVFDGLVLAIVMVALGLAALALTFLGRRNAFPGFL